MNERASFKFRNQVEYPQPHRLEAPTEEAESVSCFGVGRRAFGMARQYKHGLQTGQRAKCKFQGRSEEGQKEAGRDLSCRRRPSKQAGRQASMALVGSVGTRLKSLCRSQTPGAEDT